MSATDFDVKSYNTQELLSILLKNHTANNISFEDLPVDDTMRNFFQNPNKYIK